MDDYYLKDISHPSFPEEKITEWDFVIVDENHVRVYYKLIDGKGNGFDFYAFQSNGYDYNEHTKKDRWDKNYCFGKCMIYGSALIDGVRHMSYGDENTNNVGYKNYPNLELIIKTLQVIAELEKEHCRLSEGKK